MANLNIKHFLTKVANSFYACEKGIDNGWTYYKYPDGTYEAYQQVQLSGLSLTTASAGTYYGNDSTHDYSYPSFHINDSGIYGNAIACPTLSSGIYVYSVELFPTVYRVSVRACASNSSASIGVRMHVKGRWQSNNTSLVVPTFANTLCTDTQLNLGRYTTGGLLTASAGAIQFSIPTGRVLSHTTIEKISFYILARVGNSGTNAAANGLYIIKSSSGGTSGVTINSDVNSSFYNAQNESKTITPSMWTATIQGDTNIFITISSGSSNFFSGSSYAAQVNNQPVAFDINNISVTLA